MRTERQKPQNHRAVFQINSATNSEFCFEGPRLSSLLQSFRREIEFQRNLNKVLPDKLWFKQQFAAGVNEVTRLLERMPASSTDAKPSTAAFAPTILQAVLVASDCNPRWLTKHLPSLASSRRVPLIFIKDEKKGSLRLGELVNVKTAIAIGVKAKGSSVNQLVQQVLHDSIPDGPECTDSVDLATTQ